MKLFARNRALTPAWDLVSPSIDLLKKNIWQTLYLAFIPALLISAGVAMLPSTLPAHYTSREYESFIIIGAGAIWSFLVYPGFTYLIARVPQAQEIGIGEAFVAGLKRLLPLIGASILSGILIILGFIVFIIPGFILLRAFYLVPYYVVDQKLGPVQSLKASYRESKPVSGWIWGTIGVTLSFSILGGIGGIIPLIGVIVSLVISYLYAFGPGIRYAEVIGKRKPQPTE